MTGHKDVNNLWRFLPFIKRVKIGQFSDVKQVRSTERTRFKMKKVLVGGGIFVIKNEA